MTSFRILGLLEVRTPEGPVTISGRHHPKLLAMLLDEANRVVPTDRLAAGLWDGPPPSTAARQVQNIAAALRRQLGAAGERLRRTGSGYRIDVAADELDVLRCKRSESLALEHRSAGRLVDAERALDDALAEWRGPSLAGLSGKAVELAARRLDDYRLALTEERIDIGLSLGRHELLVNELRRLHLEHPCRQRLAEQLMLALYRCGQGPESLRVYAEVRDRLAEELGVDPGGPLRELHTAILREDPSLELEAREEPAAIAPLALPSSTTVFTGRSECLARLDASADSPTSPLVVLTGIGGVGKTMLALHWGHRSADRFPGGRIYVDLRGFSPSGAAMEPAEAVRHLLGSMGVEPRRIPADADAQIALYRGLIGSERRLLVLDNARDAAQVRPLLPSSPQVHTVVISRRRLVGLAASHGARIIEIGAFSRTEAAALLERQLGTERLAAEPESVGEILTACAGLPLALAIAAASAATRPDASLGAIAEELATSRLDALAGDEASVDLRTVFSWSFRSLGADAARTFRLLALIPGPDFGIDAVVSLHGGSREDAGWALRQLVEAHLVEHGRSGRYRLHDLIRLYAVELLESEEPKPDRDAALERLLDRYLHGADACRSALYPGMAGVPVPSGADERFEPTADEAARWLEVEWTGLIAAVEHTAEHGPPKFAWHMADVLRGYAWLRMLSSDGLRLGRAALAAASGTGDPLGTASAELSLASALIRCNRVKEGMEHAREAAESARRAGWLAGAASADGNLAIGSFLRGRPREGLGHAHAALHANRAIGDRHGECNDHHWLGILYALVGELDTSVEHFERALAIATETGADAARAVTLAHRAEVEIFCGWLDQAAAHLEEAAELERGGTGIDRSGDILGATARLRLASGRTGEALEHAKRVLAERTDAADHRFRVSAMVTLAAAYDAEGRQDEAIAHYDRVLDMTEHDTVFHRVEAMVGRAGALYRSGDAARAKDEAARALRTAGQAGYRFLEDQALNQLAEMELDAGRLGGAAELAQRALRGHRRTGHRPGEAVSLRIIAGIALAEGDRQTARRRLDEARTLCAEIGAAAPAGSADLK